MGCRLRPPSILGDEGVGGASLPLIVASPSGRNVEDPARRLTGRAPPEIAIRRARYAHLAQGRL